MLLEPRIGTRYAELIEIPIMLLVIYLAGRFVVSRTRAIESRLHYLIVGVSALSMLLVFELSLVLGLQKMPVDEYLESRDEVAFVAYIVALIIFALMPLLLKLAGNRDEA